MKYIEQMKAAMRRYNAESADGKKIMQSNAERYSEVVCAEENKRQRAILKECEDAARAKIEKAYRDACDATNEWSKLRGSDVDDDTMKLLRGGFTLDSSMLNELVIRFQGNSTMLNAVKTYADAHKIVLGYLPSTSEKLQMYRTFYNSALEYVDKITRETGIEEWRMSGWGERGSIGPEAERCLCGIPQLEHGEVAPSSAFEFSFTGVR